MFQDDDDEDASQHGNSIKLDGKLYQQFSSRDWHRLGKVKRRSDRSMCASYLFFLLRFLRNFQLLLNYFYDIFYEHYGGGEEAGSTRCAGDDDFMFMAL